ncbi:MAG: hypothetical protein AUK32_07275 [Candidatus Aquicultor secundus]|uniref:Uncharacterized protein n=1 Tax=Candidatus Aquicultor secundus TaxID=1973895 RepID=A0A2M7T8M9_9ACTN|nr:MAG: hypothetical protein AUK32_07275 [Candidatus Aquicultor secundus]PIU26956.1 MAG: hypothetical protein COT10_05995 [Candidatus Aquicultor secundus]PIX51523.1 MAG: hypothetical protein COZ51_09160 [Candidatus Aquicultor secundus]PIY40024.1 MAG: hypothetical protein COZ03_04795 [Candidatus Aquicultor secundus]PIZ38600.1 MAG: hypothetical protein COY37_05875 [Candidatus Aquicultor secundus]
MQDQKIASHRFSLRNAPQQRRPSQPLIVLHSSIGSIDKLKDFVFGEESSAIIWVQEVIELNVNQIDLDYLSGQNRGYRAP